MTPIARFILVITLVFLARCSSVTMETPLTPPEANEAQKNLEGIWWYEDGPIFLRFDSQGLGKLATLDWKNEAFEKIPGELVATQVEKDSFFSIRFKENGNWTKGYYLLKYELPNPDQLVVRAPDPEAFEQAISTGVLSGTVEKDRFSVDVVLKTSGSKLIKFLELPDNDGLFDKEKPMVLKRIKSGP